MVSANENPAGTHRARELRILSTHAIQEPLRELIPEFERAAGLRASIDFDPANALKRKIEGGAAFDVAIVTRPVIDALIGQGLMLGESCVDLARSGLGIAIHSGAPKPNIATTDAFKNALLRARSVVRSKEGTSGVYFETLLARLGIADIMRDRIILGGSGRIAELVARGEAELAVQQISELLPVQGVELVGPLPTELQLYTVFSAGVGSASANRPGAYHLVAHLARQAAAPAYETKGLEPIAR